MILPDVNVLIYAYRPDTSDHVRYKTWLEGEINGPAAYGIAPQVLASVIRICSNPRVFVHPDPPSDVFQFCRLLVEQPNAILIEPGERHWGIFESLCAASGATGNLIQDAWFAALAIEVGCEWITTDRDFARFPGLRWRTPW